MAVGHDEHTPARFVHGGGGGKTATATNTLGSPTQQRGGRARGSYGGVEGEMAVALLRWFASSATAKQERQWRSGCLLGAARGGGEERRTGAGECVGQARGRVNVTAGRARASAARGSALRRPATRGVHAAVEF